MPASLHNRLSWTEYCVPLASWGTKRHLFVSLMVSSIIRPHMKLDDVQDRIGKSEQGNIVDLIRVYSMSPSWALIFDAADHLGCFWMCSPVHEIYRTFLVILNLKL